MHPPRRDGTRKSEVGTRNSILFVPLGGHAARRILKWIGVGLLLLIVGVSIASTRRGFSVVINPTTFVSIQSGHVGLVTDLLSVNPVHTGISYYNLPLHFAIGGLPRREVRYISPSMPSGAKFYLLPLWTLFLLVAIPTAWLWYRDRRLISCSPDHLFCSGCGYDLTGNTSGVCPECGDKACPPAVLADSECSVPAIPAHDEPVR